LLGGFKIMVNVKRLETIEIEGTTKEEVKELIDNYLKIGYKLEQEISLSDDENDKYPYFAYIIKDEFGE
jgi:transposase